MPENSILITVSAVSGLIGALGSQIISALNTYFIDKRKQKVELGNEIRAKKIEIGDSFYYVTGEKMAAIKKNIRYWRNWNDSRSASSLSFLKKDMIKLDGDLETLNKDNWKFNLINLYFDVSLTTEEVVSLNAKTHQHSLALLDLGDKINKATEADKEQLYQNYALEIFKLCSLYEDIYKQMENDQLIVRNALLADYQV
jgi:hypothetical protein